MLKKFIRFVSVFAILVSTVGVTGVARADPAATATGAISPWYTGFVDKTTSDGVGTYVSVTYNPDDGLPYMSYYDAFNDNLMLASPVTPTSGNCGDNNMWWCRVVDGNSAFSGKTNGDVGWYSSIASWKGTVGFFSVWKLGISYYDATNNALKVAIWTQSPLSSGWTISIKFNPSSGEPVIAYYKHVYFDPNWFGDLMLAWPVSSGGNCGPSGNTWQCTTIDAGANAGVGQYASLGFDYNGLVHIAYYDTINSDLKYAKWVGSGGNCPTPGSSYQCDTIDSTDDVGIAASLTAPQSSTDKPRIAYYNKTSGQLKYATTAAGGGCGGGAWNCDDILSIGSGIFTVSISMTLDNNGSPVIAYEDASADPVTYLGVARPELFGNCGPTVAILSAHPHTWECDNIDGGYGGTNVSLATFTAIAVSPNGTATIAYLESDSFNTTDYLKVAYNRLQVFLPLIER
jgi:hypothetical protein